MAPHPRLRRLAARAALIAAEAMVLFGLAVAPAAAQFDDRFGFNPFRRMFQQQPQQQYWNPFQPQPEQRPAPPPVDYSKAPPPKKPETPPQTTVLVFGDSFADWLAYGLELSFTDSPEMGVTRKHRTWSGLIRQEVRSDPRGEHPDWPKLVQETLANERPDYIVMMIGLNDRRPIREARPARSGARPGQPAAATQNQTPEGANPAGTEQKSDPRKPVAGAPDEAPAGDAAAETQPPTTGSGTQEFRSERWSELYIRRIDETIAALKSKGVPVFWVGLPPVRGTRSTADISYLNDLYRSRADKGGIVYVDVWDGFVDDGGHFSMQGPDVEGQIRRLRTGDGVHFTQAGARKLAHYVERELQRWMMARSTPVSLPVEEPARAPEAAKQDAPASPAGTARPLAGPVITLTTTPNLADNDDQLLGGGRQTQTPALDAVAAKVIQKGDPMPAPAGRADDFAWPRRDIAPTGADPVVAFTTLPMTPMKAEQRQVAEAPAATPAPAAAPKPSAPQQPRVAARTAPPQQPSFFGSWFGQSNQAQQQNQYRAVQRPTFFPFLFSR